MLVQISDFNGTEPDTDKCCTEEIISDLYRCSSNNCNCKYGIPAGSTSTYCLHPDFRKFVAHPPTLIKGGAIYSSRKQSS